MVLAALTACNTTKPEAPSLLGAPLSKHGSRSPHESAASLLPPADTKTPVYSLVAFVRNANRIIGANDETDEDAAPGEDAQPRRLKAVGFHPACSAP